MNDRELLDLAANAAGIPLEWSSEPDCGPRTTGWKTWNPLADDGDALRLAVKLKMDVTVGQSVKVVCVANDGATSSRIVLLLDGEDQYAVTRRAIVRAAAEIGKKIDEPHEAG
jgi:hypothetical protein